MALISPKSRSVEADTFGFVCIGQFAAARCQSTRKTNASSLMFLYLFFNVSMSGSKPSKLLGESGPSGRALMEHVSSHTKLSKSLCILMDLFRQLTGCKCLNRKERVSEFTPKGPKQETGSYFGA
jgi:hypothetical protein